MEETREADATREHSSARGSSVLRRFGPHRLSATLRGSLIEEDADFLAAWLDEMLPTCERAVVDFELSQLEAYVSTVRTHTQDMLLRHRDRWSTVITLVRSRIVVMGATVAKVALGGNLHAFMDRDEYEKAIAAALQRSPRAAP
jgi:hypothetical protein